MWRHFKTKTSWRIRKSRGIWFLDLSVFRAWVKNGQNSFWNLHHGTLRSVTVWWLCLFVAGWRGGTTPHLMLCTDDEAILRNVLHEVKLVFLQSVLYSRWLLSLGLGQIFTMRLFSDAATNWRCQLYTVLCFLQCHSVGDFTFWLRLSLRLSLSLNFDLSTYLSQKVKWFRWAKTWRLTQIV